MQDEHTHDHDMTDDGGSGDSSEGTRPAASPMASLGNFSTGEGMVALAGIIILAVWLIFEVITDDFGVSTLTILLATGAVVFPRLDRAKVEAYHPLASLMKVIGYTLAVIGVVNIIGDIETSGFSDIGGLTLLAMLLMYAASVIAFLGARQIES